MKALVFERPWQLVMHELPDPKPGLGEVLLRSEVVGICGSDVHGFTGESGRRAPGMVMGHEVVGRVVELGRNASKFRVGDRVAVFNINSCGNCTFCKSDREQLCVTKSILGVNAGTQGAMAEYFTWPEAGLFALDADLDPAIGLLTEPIAVAIHAIQRMQPKPSDAIAIVGAGTIGIGLTIALCVSGVRTVFVLDKIPEKLELIRQFGAQPIHVDQDDPIASVRRATNGLGVSGAFEAVGAAATVRTAYELCVSGGTLVLIGNLAQEFTLPLQGVTGREITIHGSYGFTKKDFAAAVTLIADTSLPLGRLISGSCGLSDVPDVMTQLANGKLSATKMVIRP